jgi:hypothetical protein
MEKSKMARIHEMLVETGDILREQVASLNRNVVELFEVEHKFNLIKAQLVSQADVVNLPNQAMRDSKIEEILQLDEKYSKEYYEYLKLKTLNKISFTNYQLALETNKNIRTLVISYDGSDVSNG